MQKGIIGKKIGMTQIFDENGKMIPVTVVEASPNVVVQVKTVENDGYAAVQLGYGDKKATRVNKPMKGHFDKANAGYKKTLKEFKLENCDLEAGSLVKADVFAVGDIVDVSGTSKGKGYQGAIKRHNQHRLRKLTVQVLFTDSPVPWAPAPLRPVSTRARAWQVIWVLKRSPFRTSKLSRSMLKTT